METVESTSLASDEVSIGNGNMDVKKVKQHPKLGHRFSQKTNFFHFCIQHTGRQITKSLIKIVSCLELRIGEEH